MPRKFVIYDRTHRPTLQHPENTENYIEYEVHEEKHSTGPGVDDFEVVEVKEELKTNINEFINSYKDEVGIDVIMRRLATSGDLSLLNQKEAVYMDTTIIPEDPGEAFALSQSVQKKFAELDPKLTEGKNIETFIEEFNKEKLDKYIEELVAQKLEEKKE